MWFTVQNQRKTLFLNHTRSTLSGSSRRQDAVPSSRFLNFMLFSAPLQASRPRRMFPSVFALCLLCALGSCTTDRASGDPYSELSVALDHAPGIAPRLSAASTFRACTEQVPAEETIPRSLCPPTQTGPADELDRLERQTRGDDPRSLQTRAAMELVRDDSSGIAMDSAIAWLRRAAELSDNPAPVLNDLAAGLLVRAEREQAPRDLLEAYETAEKALQSRRDYAPALYNRALALDRFGLVDETAQAWRDYLAADSTSGWATEARRRLDATLAIAPPTPPAPNAPLSAYAAYAAAEPQGARELGMDRLLGEWGEAVLAGDTARAADRLRRGEALGVALEQRRGGDASLADEVRSIHTAASPAAIRSLAVAHREYAAGREAFDRLDFASSEPRFAAAEAAAGASPALRDWASASLAIVRVQLNVRGAPEALRRASTAAEREADRYPALAGRALGASARTTGQGEVWERALLDARRSARLFATAGERGNEGAVLGMLADTYIIVGEQDSAYAAIHGALERLRPYRGTLRLHNQLLTTARAAASDGLLRAAIRIQGEGVAVAGATHKPENNIEARLARSRLYAAAGDIEHATADVRVARALMESLRSPAAWKWFTADLLESEGVVALRTQPAAAMRALDSASATFLRTGVRFRAIPALVSSAQARLAVGDQAGASGQFARVVEILDQRRDSIRIEPRRAAVFDAARGVVDRIVVLKLAENRVGEALSYMDRARASLAPTGQRDAGADTLLASPPGETVVEYARIADTVFVWTVSGRAVAVSRTVVDSVRLARTIESVETLLQQGASESEVRPGLSRLYDWLIRPVEARLGSDTSLVIIADGEIAAVPFAALYDTRRGEYVIKRHSLRFAVSLRESRRPPRAGADGVLLVADPTFDQQRHHTVERLTSAVGEVRAIRGIYPNAAVLEGPAATPRVLERAIPRAGIVHFAGHAVFDDQRPERSYLLLASAAGGAGDDEITADELARFDLRQVRLVVLSACRTVRSGRSRAGGFSGLSGALLAAGAGGAIGSTWNVDDTSTAALMSAFHRTYAGRHDGPGALRSAQLTLLGSRDPGLRSPAAWAGFRYAGR